MKIYTLFYKESELYNHNVFVMPNDKAAIRAMKMNLIDPKQERFRAEVANGDIELHVLCDFEEDSGAYFTTKQNTCVINLKELLNDDKGNSTEIQNNDAN